jgi:PKHD-type hydroxylase
MFLHIKEVLAAEEVALFRQKLWAADTPWVDGARSAGGQAVHQKNNLQLAQSSDLSAQLQGVVKAALHRNALPCFFQQHCRDASTTPCSINTATA